MSLLYFPSQASSDSGGGQLVLIKKQTISGSTASVSFINGTSDVVFDGTYKTYMILVEQIQGDTDEVSLRLSSTTDGTNFNIATTWAHNAPYTYGDGTGTGSDTEGAAAATTGAHLGNIINNSIASNNAIIYYSNPASSAYKKFRYQTDDVEDDSPAGHWSSASRFGAATVATTSTVTGFRFAPASGNFSAGDITLFGIKTS